VKRLVRTTPIRPCRHGTTNRPSRRLHGNHGPISRSPESSLSTKVGAANPSACPVRRSGSDESVSATSTRTPVNVMQDTAHGGDGGNALVRLFVGAPRSTRNDPFVEDDQSPSPPTRSP
jgi:hypothetical protein